MPRTASHTRETESRDYIRSIINSFYPNGDALIREWSERDYGIDFVVELFDKGIPTGKIAFLQIKGTSKEIQKLKKTDEVACPNVSLSSLEYAKQRRIPFILLYVSMSKERYFYYIDLQSVYENDNSILSTLNKKKNIRIPCSNKITKDLKDFFGLINSYYTS